MQCPHPRCPRATSTSTNCPGLRPLPLQRCANQAGAWGPQWWPGTSLAGAGSSLPTFQGVSAALRCRTGSMTPQQPGPLLT